MAVFPGRTHRESARNHQGHVLSPRHNTTSSGVSSRVLFTGTLRGSRSKHRGFLFVRGRDDSEHKFLPKVTQLTHKSQDRKAGSFSQTRTSRVPSSAPGRSGRLLIYLVYHSSPGSTSKPRRGKNITTKERFILASIKLEMAR